MLEIESPSIEMDLVSSNRIFQGLKSNKLASDF